MSISTDVASSIVSSVVQSIIGGTGTSSPILFTAEDANTRQGFGDGADVTPFNSTNDAFTFVSSTGTAPTMELAGGAKILFTGAETYQVTGLPTTINDPYYLNMEVRFDDLTGNQTLFRTPTAATPFEQLNILKLGVTNQIQTNLVDSTGAAQFVPTDFVVAAGSTMRLAFCFTGTSALISINGANRYLAPVVMDGVFESDLLALVGSNVAGSGQFIGGLYTFKFGLGAVSQAFLDNLTT